MADVLFFPPFPDRIRLFDQLFRSVWHFLPALHRLDRLIFPYSGDDFPLLDAVQTLDMAKLYLSRDLDPDIADYAMRYNEKIVFREALDIDPSNYPATHYKKLKGIIVWNVRDDQTIAAAKKIAEQTGAELIWADPSVVHQETIVVIRFVYQLLAQAELETLVNQSYENFQAHLLKWQGRAVSAFGNGPSLGRVVESKVNFGTTLRAVCNSTIADRIALEHLQPDLLFCGDPVQHCGPSLYAGRFRQALASAMTESSRVVITQLGYVPYFKQVIPQESHDRIIGIGNDRRTTFNIDLTAEFLTASTANIFTMLVLPTVFTISKRVDIYGCDGTPFSAAIKPWSHANEEDYMSKMAVTHRVHPGFWVRNYEEEFWNYCNDIEDIVIEAESKGIDVRSMTPSYVPALAKRHSSVLQNKN